MPSALRLAVTEVSHADDIRQILCPTDFSETSRRAIAHATVIARWYGASLTVLHVCDSSGAMLGRIREQIAASCAEATASGVPVIVLVDPGRPAAAIVDRAASMPADLIVIGTHGAGGFEHLVLGSVAEKVLRKAGCPVLTVPPHAEGSALPFKRILCAVDFSAWSLRAFELAQSLARESGAALTALSVIEWPWQEPPAPVFAELPAEQAAALAEYRRYMEEAALRRLTSLVEQSAANRGSVTASLPHRFSRPQRTSARTSSSSACTAATRSTCVCSDPPRTTSSVRPCVRCSRLGAEAARAGGCG